MNFNKHLNLVGKHAIFGASKCSWINKDNDGMMNSYINSFATEIGTALHDIARGFIEEKIKFKKIYKPVIFLILRMMYHIPRYAINLDEVSINNLMAYINDGIGYRMSPEVVLYYSDRFFGTADTISFKDNCLRIHDLKTGKTPVHMEQLQIYAALFCLEYNVKPYEISMELCIYQNNECISYNPTPEDIVPIMDKIVMADKMLSNLINQEK